MGKVSSIYFVIYVLGAIYIMCAKTNPYKEPDTVSVMLKKKIMKLK